jgi:HD-like signal output (HDOD) protein
MDKSVILDRLHQLPAMPLVVQEVMASFKDEHAGSASLARKIAFDQGLSARVLRVANSSFYGLQREVGSIQDAVMVLGFDTVRSLVLSVGVMRAFQTASAGSFDRQAYWKHSFRVAVYTEALAQCLGRDRRLAFAAGMFHEVGLLVLDVCIPQQFAAALARQRVSGVDMVEIERAELGFDHAGIGAEMARRWNFPLGIEHAIHYWRTPEHEPFEPLTGMVHVAVLLESGLSGAGLTDNLPATLCNRLQLSWGRIEACMPQPEQLDAVANLMLAT